MNFIQALLPSANSYFLIFTGNAGLWQLLFLSVILTTLGKAPNFIYLNFLLRKWSYIRKDKHWNMSSKYIKPTESELEILQILWQKGLATVREVHEELSKSKEVGYTTTLKLMQIMHEKGIVQRDESMRTHVYQAAVNKEKTQQHLLGKMINTLFGGSSTQLVLQALGNNEGKVSQEELDQIQSLLDNLKKQ